MFKLALLILVFVVTTHDAEGHWGRYGYRRWGHRWNWRPWWRTVTNKMTTTTKPPPCKIINDPNAKIFLFNGKYYAFSTILLNHDQAQAACKAGCGNLVAINSPQEQAFIESKTTAGGDWYIGLTKGSGNWHWSNGAAITYNNYGNNPVDAATCGYLDQVNKWMRVTTCNVPHRFICETV